VGLGSCPRPFWISVLMFFPGGPQRRDRLSPRGAYVGEHAVVGAVPVGCVDPVDLDPVGAVDALAVGWVWRG